MYAVIQQYTKHVHCTYIYYILTHNEESRIASRLMRIVEWSSCICPKLIFVVAIVFYFIGKREQTVKYTAIERYGRPRARTRAHIHTKECILIKFSFFCRICVRYNRTFVRTRSLPSQSLVFNRVFFFRDFDCTDRVQFIFQKCNWSKCTHTHTYTMTNHHP